MSSITKSQMITDPNEPYLMMPSENGLRNKISPEKISNQFSLLIKSGIPYAVIPKKEKRLKAICESVITSFANEVMSVSEAEKKVTECIRTEYRLVEIPIPGIHQKAPTIAISAQIRSILLKELMQYKWIGPTNAEL